MMATVVLDVKLSGSVDSLKSYLLRKGERLAERMCLRPLLR